ncbi:MAG TPA: hypothetical protein PLZ84_06085 [Clostridia bacterium]|mgnify:CR=1 FL=1|nr:hypothetical protein [Clostridia bacterium]
METIKKKKHRKTLILLLSLILSAVVLCWYTYTKLRNDSRNHDAIFISDTNGNGGINGEA